MTCSKPWPQLAQLREEAQLRTPPDEDVVTHRGSAEWRGQVSFAWLGKVALSPRRGARVSEAGRASPESRVQGGC